MREHIVTIVERRWYTNGVTRHYPVCKDSNCGWMGRSYILRERAFRRAIEHQKYMRFEAYKKHLLKYF